MDFEGAPTTKYRPHPIIAGYLSTNHIKAFLTVLFLAGLTVGLYLTYIRGVIILVFIVIGFVLSFFYTGPPLKFKYRALGELSIFFAFGPVMVMGAYYVQASSVSLRVLFASIPIGILIAMVAFANNLRDVKFDTSVGLKTLPSLLGVERSIKFFFAMNSLAIMIVPVLALIGFLPLLTAISIVAIVNVFKLVKIYSRGVPDNADPLAAQLVILFGMLFILGSALSILFPLSELNVSVINLVP